jgi:hypothetical protein
MSVGTASTVTRVTMITRMLVRRANHPQKQPIDIILKEGVGGLTKFSRMTKKESRDRPKTFYVLISVIFGTGSKY